MAMLNLSSSLKRYWVAMMSIYFIQHPAKTILPASPFTKYALRVFGGVV